MRRALDIAKTKLDALGERDSILDWFFGHAKSLFQFTVLFVVPGDIAQGRNVEGLGAPSGLVTRLSFPLDEPSILSRARDLRRPFVAGKATPLDEQIFGSLGRAMPGALVVPLVVRHRVVAILVGEGANDAIVARAQEAGRHPTELTKEEMLLWAEAVGEALERVILRRKGGSLPPPPGAPATPSSLAPPAPRVPQFSAAPSPNPPFVAPQASPAPAALPAPALDFSEPPAEAEGTPEGSGERTPRWLIAVVAAACVIVGGVFLWRRRPHVVEAPIVLAGSALPGWPRAVDPKAALEAARGASSLGDKPELLAIHGEVAPSGNVDFTGPVTNKEGTYLTFLFGTDKSEAEVRIGPEGGAHAPVVQPRSLCGGAPCRPAVPAPSCAIGQIWASLGVVGLLPDERGVFTYAAPKAPAVGAPVWSVAVANRGTIQIDPATCRPLAGETLAPPMLPIAKIPGAPSAVEPVALVALARKQSGLREDAALLEIDARGVRRTGLVDLNLPEAGITYTFAEAPTAQGRRWREVFLRKEGMPVTSTETDGLSVPTRLLGEAPPLPLCSVAFAIKTAEGLPEGAVVRVTYSAEASAEASGEWRVEVSSLGLRHRVSDGVCEAWEGLEKTGSTARPQKPGAPKKKSR